MQPARLCIHLPDDAALVHILPGDAGVVLGRGTDSDLRIEHASVSRRHAVLEPGAAGWTLRDLGSKNGVRIASVPIASAVLTDAGWFTIGDVYCHFEPLTANELDQLAARAAQRRHQSQAWAERIQQSGSPDALLADLVTGMVELAQCRRGFLLAGDAPERLRVRASFAMDAAAFAAGGLSYCTGAVARALDLRRPIYMSSAEDQAWLQQRASVVGQDLRVLACLPLLFEDRLLGVAYVDSDEAGKLFTRLDAEILDAFVQHAAHALAAAELQQALARIESWVAVGATQQRRRIETPAPVWRELARSSPA